MASATVPTAAALPPHPPAFHSQSFGFDHAELGMRLKAWRALSPQKAIASCRQSQANPDTLDCPSDPVPLGGDFYARNVTYIFRRGTLASISFISSTNGFDFVTAALRRQFGDPNTIKRDSFTLPDGVVFPHVLMTWSNGRSMIKLNDPVAAGTTLNVTISVKAVTADLTSSG